MQMIEEEKEWTVPIHFGTPWYFHAEHNRKRKQSYLLSSPKTLFKYAKLDFQHYNLIGERADRFTTLSDR